MHLSKKIKPLVFLGMILQSCSHQPSSYTLKDTNTSQSNVDPQHTANLLVRAYADGETVSYLMTGQNQVNQDIHEYSLTSIGLVKRDQDGAFYEESGWSKFVYDGTLVNLDAASLAFRELDQITPISKVSTGHFVRQITYILCRNQKSLFHFKIMHSLPRNLSNKIAVVIENSLFKNNSPRQRCWHNHY